MRRSRFQQNEEELNVWPAFTDLMSNAFMILSLFLLLAIIKSVFIQSISDANASRSLELERELQQRRDQISGLGGEVTKLQTELQQRGTKIAQLEGEIARLKSPPIIVVRDSETRRFESGSADINPGLQQFITQDLVEQIKTLSKDYQGYIIEVIGHTDGESNSGSFSNLDQNLEQVIANNQSVNVLTPGSNADLGLMRALAVVQQLQNNPELQPLGLTFKAYSAAQLYDASGNYVLQNQGDDASRRRIEIRFTPKAVEQ